LWKRIKGAVAALQAPPSERPYETVKACEAVHDQAVAEWLDGMKPFRLDLRLAGSRCGPAEADQDRDDI
jgi:hypothetical protein